MIGVHSTGCIAEQVGTRPGGEAGWLAGCQMRQRDPVWLAKLPGLEAAALLEKEAGRYHRGFVKRSS